MVKTRSFYLKKQQKIDETLKASTSASVTAAAAVLPKKRRF
jgi:hypothetical protein